MKRLAAGLALLAVTGALVFPSAAAPFALGQSDAITQDVSLAPADTPNGDYAYLDENDDLVVDLSATNPNLDGDAEGVNGDGITTVSNVFEIHYNGTRYAHVWITDESEDVTFTVDGDPIQSEANNVTLGPNESVAVGVVVDTTGEGATDGLLDEMQVHATVADPKDVNGGTDGGDGGTAGTAGTDGGTDDAGTGVTGNGVAGSGDGGTALQQFAPSPTERSLTVVNPPAEGFTTIDLDGMRLGAGANLTLDEIRIRGSNGGVISLDLAATAPERDDDVVGIESLGAVEVTESQVGAVEDATLRFSADRQYLDARGIAPADLVVFHTSDGETSTLPVRIVGDRDGRVVFEADTPGFSTFTVAALRPSIEVTEADLSTGSLGPNETATVTARLRNDGRAAGSRTVTLTVDGEAIAERTVSLAPGESTVVTFDVAPDGAGEYAVAVDGTTAGTLVVEAAGSPTPGEPSPDEQVTDADLGTSRPVEEPAGLGLPEAVGLAVLLSLVAVTLVLARRVTR